MLEALHCIVWNSIKPKLIYGGLKMTIPEKKIYPRTGDRQTIYLKSVITNPNITVGDYTLFKVQ